MSVTYRMDLPVEVKLAEAGDAPSSMRRAFTDTGPSS